MKGFTVVWRDSLEVHFKSKSHLGNLRLQLDYLNFEAIYNNGQRGGFSAVLAWLSEGLGVCFKSKFHFHIDINIQSQEVQV